MEHLMEHPLRGLFYCQYLMGIGHLIRSLHLCRSLIKKFEIDFLLGGHDINVTLHSPHFHHLNLTPIDYIDTGKATDKIRLATEEKFDLRRAFFESLDKKYAFLIIELFPFGRWEFKNEIEPLIKKIKSINPDCLILCSLRDSFPPKTPDKEEKILAFFLKYFDYVFIHSDPLIYKIEESYSLASKIHDKAIYTGFITNPESNIQQKRLKRIVVSQGSGAIGEELFEAVVKVANFFPDYQFYFIPGPYSPPTLPDKIKNLAKEIKTSNVHIKSFVEDFPEYLSSSALSISLGGYTIIDAVYTKTPALVLPWLNLDQYIRAIKFSGFGYLKMISVEQLSPAILRNAIQEALSMFTPSIPIKTSGAQTTCHEIERLLKEKNVIR